ncbi:MAG: threonine--tRNA ligase [Alphaproteobacteria bacterium]|nr:threonine--tRNA ligase [Alphaproteobacteria bacterium]
MIRVTLPDGSLREYNAGIHGLGIAESISPSLAKRAVAIRVNGDQYDLTRPIATDATIELIMRDSEEGLEILRHDAAHVIAEAVKELFPETQVTIGPAIENGFYYDFHRPTSFTPEDLVAIEKRMAEIVDRDEPITREEMSREEAIALFKSMGEHFKVEIVEAIPAGDTLTVYRQGGFVDLCRGPHLPSTKSLGKAFKLTKIAGAYWRGDSKNPMLQRIYGTAWDSEKSLKQYLTFLEEAEKRDHRKIGKTLDLFHLQEEAPGCVFWHPNGWTIYRALKDYIQKKTEAFGYQEVNTPQLLDRSFWEASGHWEKFRDGMFITEDEAKTLCVKPMSCPCHVQIFRQGLKSYRDLPLRFSEFGICHRNEPSGALHGLMRVRAMVQDDGHIFCREDQIVSETKAFCEQLKEVYKELGFDSFLVRFSDRPAVRAGTDETWDKAEQALKEATIAAGLDFVLNSGEGAFYGPKLEFVLKDAIGRQWQCGTLQLDFVLPERLDAAYVGEDGKKHRPVMLHRAMIGTFERFLGILIEHHAGKFPVWMTPTQVVVTPITNDQDDYAKEVVELLLKQGLRVKIDLRPEKINYKIREWSLLKVPFILVVGGREASERTVALRQLGSTEQTMLTLDDARAFLALAAKGPMD